MRTSYLEEKLRSDLFQIEREIDHLHNELRSLRENEKDISREEFNKDFTRLNELIEEYEKKREETEEKIALIEEITNTSLSMRELRNLINKERNDNNKTLLEEVFEQKESELINNRSKYTQEELVLLEQDLNNRFNNTQEEINETNLENQDNSTIEELEQVNKQLNQSIENFQKIFEEERLKRQEGPFDGDELDQINKEFMDKKIEENKIFESLKQRKEELESKLKINSKEFQKIIDNAQIPRLPGPVLGDAKGITGPTIGDTKGIPGPTIGETKGIPQKKDPIPPQKPKRGLRRIIDDLTQGLDIKVKDNKKYKASNIHIYNNFKNELKSGNYLYNIVHTAGTVLKVPFQLLSKLKNKIVYRKKDKERINTLKNRIDKLSEEDLMTIYKEYRSNQVLSERFPTILNTLLDEKMNEFIMGKVTAINTKLEKSYQEVFADYMELEEINKKLSEENIDKKTKKALNLEKEKLLNGKAKQIETIRNDYIEANNYLSGGLHGFSEDMKAAFTKLSCVGKRFAKDHDLDHELLAEEASLEDLENKAIALGNDELALDSFIKAESLLSENTEIRNSAFGKRSVGKKYYSPLAEMLDYRDDPFIRDVFTTVAIAGATISTVNALVTEKRLHEVIENNQQESARVNDINNQTIKEVNETGQHIVAQNDSFTKGLKAEMNQAITDASGVIERKNLDLTDWHIGTDKYHALDTAGHKTYEAMYDSTKSSIADIAHQYGNGSISQTDALEQYIQLANETQSKLVGIYDSYIPILTKYAASHPQFDLSGVLSAMKYISKHPNAITNMNNSMSEVINSGQSLVGLTAEQVKALDSLPSDLSTTILGTASSATLAYNVAKSIQEKQRKTHYGNNVTDMVDEYVNSKYEEMEEEQQKVV